MTSTPISKPRNEGIFVAPAYLQFYEMSVEKIMNLIDKPHIGFNWNNKPVVYYVFITAYTFCEVLQNIHPSGMNLASLICKLLNILGDKSCLQKPFCHPNYNYFLLHSELIS